MATRKHTAPAEAQLSESTQPADFDRLLSRLLNLVGHFQLVDQRLVDLQDVPEELQPAAITLHDATEALDKLHTEFDGWNVTSAAESGPSSRIDAIHATVETQHSRLINVISTVRCLRFSEEAGELGGALELVEMELQRITDALEGPRRLERPAVAAEEQS